MADMEIAAASTDLFLCQITRASGKFYFEVSDEIEARGNITTEASQSGIEHEQIPGC